MDAYVFQAALLCTDCAQARIIAIESTRPLPAGYVAEQIDNRREGIDMSVLREWADYYKGENVALDEAMQEWRDTNPEEWT
jgi:hypothetical protein